MPNDPARYCATDKEIYDLLMSSKKKISDTVMLTLARDRGILYSPKESRDDLASRLSLLTHGFHDLSVLIEQRELSTRGEKTTSLTLPPLTLEELKAISSEFSANAVGEDKITSFQKGTDGFEVKVEYSEMDYSKTRLIQRRQKEASIEFDIQQDRTVVRLPSTDKAQAIAENLRKRIEEKRKAEMPAVRIELTQLTEAQFRTEFFTKLITEMAGFFLENVTSIKVHSSSETTNEAAESIEDDATAEDAKSEILSIVQNAVLKGQSLLSTELYQRLKESGFFITSIVWDARQKDTQSILQFEAGFDDPKAGVGFKYNVRGVRRYENGEHTKTYRPVPDSEEKFLFDVMEKTASYVLSALSAKQSAAEELPPYDDPTVV